jgi:hypothetical protein
MSQSTLWSVEQVNFWSATSTPTCSDDSCVNGQDWIYDFEVGSDSNFTQSFTPFTGTATGMTGYYGCAFRSLTGSCSNSPISSWPGWQYGSWGCEWLPVGG